MATGRMTTGRIAVIGGGVAGLAAAARLASAGVEVLLLERAARPGGKMREVTVAGRALDAGPTVFTMRWVFEELLEACGAGLEALPPLAPAEVLARHAWDGSDARLDLFSDVERTADAIAAFAGPDEGRRYRAFVERARAIYRTLERSFIAAQRPSPLGLVARIGLGRPAALARIAPLSTLWSALGGAFRDPRLRQLYGRYATYCGSSPFLAPATLMLVAAVEQDGVWTVEGGMARLAEALAALAVARGAEIRCGVEVAALELAGGRVVGVRLADGERIAAAAVIHAGDVGAIGAGLLGPEAARAVPSVPRRARSLSAVVWSLVAPARGFPLHRHTVFFSADYADEFARIFRGRRLPASPTVYVAALDRDGGASEAAPDGPERLHVLVNAPADGDDPSAPGLSESEIDACETTTFELLARAGLEIARRPDATLRTTPAMFHRLFPATGGALYGRANHGPWATFARPGATTRLPGLYLASGSAHPGPGVPMATLSGRLAAERVLADLFPARTVSRASTVPTAFASSARRRPAATPGGTSTG